MTTSERRLIFALGALYAAGILFALLTTHQVTPYLPHAAIFVVSAAAVRHMLRDRHL